MLKFLQSFIFIIFLTSSSLAEEIVFYKDPSYERLKEIIDSYANNKDNSSFDEDNLARHLTVIFYFYPELIKNIESDIQNYPKLIQKPIVQSIVNTNGWTNNLPKEYQNLDQNKLNMNINFLIYSDPEKSNFNLMITEFFIQAFNISGDVKYLEKVLRFISNFPRGVKKAVHKITYENARQDEVQNLYAKMSDHHTKLANQLIEILDFLDKKRSINPQLDIVIKEIVSSNKNFDYRK